MLSLKGYRGGPVYSVPEPPINKGYKDVPGSRGPPLIASGVLAPLLT